MPSVKRAVASEEVKTGFESYDGPPITQRGFYRSKVRGIKYKTFKENNEGVTNTGLSVMLVLEAAKGDPKKHAKFDGLTTFTNIIFSDKDSLLTRESNFYAALGLADNPTLVFPNGETTGRGLEITSLGGKKLAALLDTVVNADIKISNQPGYVGDPEVDGIYKYKAPSASSVVSDDEEEDDADLLEDDDAATDDAEENEPEEGTDDDYDERKTELTAAGLPALRTIAKEYEIVTTGLKKDALVEAILGYEFEDDGAAVLADDEEEEEEEEAEAEEEEEEEGDDEQAARVEELSSLDRVALKAILKELAPDQKVFKSTTDEDLRTSIIDLEFGDETPF